MINVLGVTACVFSVVSVATTWKRELCSRDPISLYRNIDGEFTPDTNEAASRGFVVIGIILLSVPSWIKLIPGNFIAAYLATGLAWAAIHVGSHDLCSPKCPTSDATVTLGPGVFIVYMAVLAAVVSLIHTYAY